uniref:Uncharacterized protein n=1 Tax=Rhizophora mucronata TaxID=61149 RepID=A0A2P2JS55_RHIMU
MKISQLKLQMQDSAISLEGLILQAHLHK